ncbi:MAG TPA: MerR family transcriptional regulator [Verrucomicrobiae bacterium]|nr:MerR family transcriptional regulator [Verrucomicrobiae bacterium]
MIADYYTPEQIARRFNISSAQVARLSQIGLLRPTIKNERTFYSSQQVYKLDVAVRQVKAEHLSLEQAIDEVDKRWMAAKQDSQQA